MAGTVASLLAASLCWGFIGATHVMKN